MYRNEEYVKPKASKKPFQGSGQVLGSIAPQVNLSGAENKLINSAQIQICCPFIVGI